MPGAPDLITYPIQLRPDMVAVLYLPSDLSVQEAARLAAYVDSLVAADV